VLSQGIALGPKALRRRLVEDHDGGGGRFWGPPFLAEREGAPANQGIPRAWK
jgi:hypothetical protein